MVYLDTSVLAAYYCPEAMSAIAEKTILRCKRPTISSLVEVEFHSAVARKVREGTLSVADATRIITQLHLHIESGCYERLPIQETHFVMARDWIGTFLTPLRTLDALHLAVCLVANANLLTADTNLAKSAHQFGVQVERLGQNREVRDQKSAVRNSSNLAIRKTRKKPHPRDPRYP